MSGADPSFPVRGVDPDRLFLDEVARLLPDVDVVAIAAPQPSGLPAPDDASADDRLLAARTLAVEGLHAVWQAAFGGWLDPGAIILRWTQHRFLDAVAAEAMVRLPGRAAAASASVEDVELALTAAGWNCLRRDPSGPGDRRIVGLDEGSRAMLDLVVLQRADVVLLRLRTAEVIVGVGRANDLLDAGADEAPWPL